MKYFILAFGFMFFWLQFSLYILLDSDAENAILVAFQLYKATQQDEKVFLHLMHGHELQAWTTTKVLVSLMINVGAKNLLVDGDIEKFVCFCTHYLQNISCSLDTN
jgi:hypothetical protein